MHEWYSRISRIFKKEFLKWDRSIWSVGEFKLGDI